MKKLLLALILLFTAQSVFAEPKHILDEQVYDTINRFEAKVPGGHEFLQKSAGYLVIPSLIKAGFVVGGEYGQGALMLPGNDGRFHIAEYYSMTSASIGWQVGAQKRSLILAFFNKEALEKFRKGNKWKVGVDGSVSFVDVGASVDLSTVAFKKSIVAIVFGNKGLMAGLSLDGSVFSKIQK